MDVGRLEGVIRFVAPLEMVDLFTNKGSVSDIRDLVTHVIPELPIVVG